MHAHDIVSVIELIFRIPTAILAIAICAIRGFHRSSGWIYTLILCFVRIAGAICQFLSHSNHSDRMIQAIIIVDSIGLLPLLLAPLGMLSRFVDFINTKSTPTSTTKHFRILQLLTTLSLILSIAGGTSGNKQPDGIVQVDSTSKVGTVLYVVAYAGLILIYLASVPRTHAVPTKERRVPVSIAFALPYILVRLVYSSCGVFLHIRLFSIVTGNVVVRVMMAIIEEFVVVVICISLGFLVDELDVTTQGPIGGREWKNKKQAQQERKEVYHGRA